MSDKQPTIWPITHPTAQVQDGRWSVSHEFCGYKARGFVARFCDDHVSSHETIEAAIDAAHTHASAHFASL